MADSSGTDGLVNEVSEFDKNASSKLSNAQSSTHASTHESDTSTAASNCKRLKMDRDDDGAPSSSETSPAHHKGGEQHTVQVAGGRDSIVSFDSSAESASRKSLGNPRCATSAPQTPSAGLDLSMIDMKTSWDGSAASGGSTKGETTDGETGYRVPFKHRAGMLADPIKIAKEREKEERVRQARERLKEERQRKLQELKEQQRVAQENRERQLEMRRKKIEDLRRRDVERRAAVEERRKLKEDIERARRESILQRAEERVARFEAWKAGGRKGMHGEGDSPSRQFSLSTSVLYTKHGQEYSSLSALRPPSRPESSLGLETIREGRRSFIGATTWTPSVSGTTQHYQRASNNSATGASLSRASLTASMPSPIKMRENKPARKQRPASVASSMPSFVGGEPAKSPRSKSTDRTGRDRSKARPPRKDKALKDKENLTEKTLDDTEENEKEKDGDKDGARDRSHKKEKRERVSLSFFDRLSTPKFSKKDPEVVPRETPPKKDSPVIRVQFADGGELDGVVEPERSFIREKPSPSHAKELVPKHAPSKDVHRVTTSASAGRSVSPSRNEVDKSGAGISSLGHKGGDKASTTASCITPPPSATSTPTHGPAAQTPVHGSTATSTNNTPSHSTTTPSADDGTTASRSAGAAAQDITAEEYKARLAEKRRQARERAEKEAEEERRRQEEARLAEEERQRKEEEEERRFEEESLYLAEKAKRAEAERLERAIEAEERRKREEAEKLEQEKQMKEEAEKKAKEEADRLGKEKQERARKEEEERLQRKKKLEMIMKRVKTDSTPDTSLKIESPTKSFSSSPNISQMNSSQNSPDEIEKPVASSESSDEEAQTSVAEGSAVETYSSSMTTSFFQDMEETNTASLPRTGTVHNAMSEDILDRHRQSSMDEVYEHGTDTRLSSTTTPSKPEERAQSSDTPAEPKSKFRSPLLQQLVDNHSGSSSSGGTKFKSPLLQNLLGKTKVGGHMGLSSSTGDLSSRDSPSPMSRVDGVMSSSMIVSSSDNDGTSKESFKQGRDDEDKDEDTSVHESFEHHSVSNGIGKDSSDGHFPKSTSKSSIDVSPLDATKLPISMMNDSALGSSIEPHGEGVMSQSMNGHGDHKSHGLDDSSISLYSIGEGVTSSASVIGTLPEPETLHGERLPSHSEQLDQYIDLIDTNGKSGSRLTGMPIIAFEENNRRSDVTEYLS